MPTESVVYSQDLCLGYTRAGGRAASARYSHRIALSNRRLIDGGDRRVGLHYPTAPMPAPETLWLEPEELMRRFLLHVLPKGFVRVRRSGSSPTTAPEKRLAAIRETCRRRRSRRHRTRRPRPRARATHTPARIATAADCGSSQRLRRNVSKEVDAAAPFPGPPRQPQRPSATRPRDPWVPKPQNRGILGGNRDTGAPGTEGTESKPPMPAPQPGTCGFAPLAQQGPRKTIPITGADTP